MEQFTIEQKIEIHNKALIIFKNVIEAAMQIEKDNLNNNTFAYIVSNSSDCDSFFNHDSLFMSLMNQKKILLRTKVPYHQIYFPLFILAKIINEDIFQIEEYSLIETYAEYLEENNLLEEDVNYDNDLEIIGQMTREPGIFWINKSGCTKDRSDFTNIQPEQIVFKFNESYVEQYDLQDDGKYIKKLNYPTNETYIDIDGKKKRKLKVVYKELEVHPKLSNKERYIKFTKEITKFSFEKHEMIEYTLQDIYCYLNKQLELFDTLDKLDELNQNLKSELKNPKMIQKLLDSGLSVEEALESIGF